MVSFPDASANPRAVVVHSLYAYPTLVAMACTMWPENVAGGTKF